MYTYKEWSNKFTERRKNSRTISIRALQKEEKFRKDFDQS